MAVSSRNNLPHPVDVGFRNYNMNGKNTWWQEPNSYTTDLSKVSITEMKLEIARRESNRLLRTKIINMIDRIQSTSELQAIVNFTNDRT